MATTTQDTRTPLRVELVTHQSRLDVTQFVNNIQYGYATTPPWDTVSVDLLAPMYLLDKILPGTGVQVNARASAAARTPEPGFWVIVWLEDWPNFRSSTAMAVGHVDTIAFGERDVASTSAVPVKGTTPCTLRCTGMLALVGKSNVRMTMSSEQNADGFLYSLDSFKGAMKAHLGNLANNEVGGMLTALWKETVKVRAPWGQAGGQFGTAQRNGDSPAAQTAYAELGQEIPVVYNQESCKAAPPRRHLLRPVYGKQLMHIPALWPDSSLWQWFHGMFVPDSEVVELFATLDPPTYGEPGVTTALARSLGGAQPALHYRFKPFALDSISLATIKGQTHLDADRNTSVTPMSEQLGLFQEQLKPFAEPATTLLHVKPTDIYSHEVTWDDSKRVNLVFARPAIISGTGSIRPFSQAGNVVIPDRSQFAYHGLRAFEVDWPYLAVQDLREQIVSYSGTSTSIAQDAKKLEETVRTFLQKWEEDWAAAYGPVTDGASQASFPEEPLVYLGKKTIKDVEDMWRAWRQDDKPTTSYSIDERLLSVRETNQALDKLASTNPRHAGPSWDKYEAVASLRGHIQVNLANRKRQLELAIAAQPIEAGTEFGMEFRLAVGSLQAREPTKRMLFLLVDALEQDLADVEAVMAAYTALKVPKGTVPVSAPASGTAVAAPGAFQADHTLTNEFSALNELLWSIKGEGERFADMVLVLRGRPLLRQGYYLEGDLGPRAKTDTVFRYFTGYIENVHHEFRVEKDGQWVSRTTVRLSRVWFNDVGPVFYTPVAAASLGNQTKSEQPNQVLRGKSVYGSNSSSMPLAQMYDVSGWENMRTAYKMVAAAKADKHRKDSKSYPVKGVVFHHTATSTTKPHHTLAAWRDSNSKTPEKVAAAAKKGKPFKTGETASHYEITPDGVIWQYYNPDYDVLHHAVTKVFPPLPPGEKDHPSTHFFKNLTVGIDLTGDFRFTEPTAAQYDSARTLVRYLANKFGFVPVVKPLPASIRPEGNSSTTVDLSNVNRMLLDKYTIWGHGSIWPTECPGKKMDLSRVVEPLGAVYEVFDASPESAFSVVKITNANAKDHYEFLSQSFPDVKVW